MGFLAHNNKELITFKGTQYEALTSELGLLTWNLPWEREHLFAIKELPHTPETTSILSRSNPTITDRGGVQATLYGQSPLWISNTFICKKHYHQTMERHILHNKIFELLYLCYPTHAFPCRTLPTTCRVSCLPI